MEAEVGRLDVEKGTAIVPKHQPKERVYSLSFMELALRLGTEVSFRNAVWVLNRALHRKGKETVKERTYQDLCHRAGEEVTRYQRRTSGKVLKEHHFDSKTCQPESTEELAPALREGGASEIDCEVVREAIEAINAKRPLEEEQIKGSTAHMEEAAKTCYVSIDEIGVKHQKEQRKQAGEKQGVYVWNTVAVVQSAWNSYTLTGGAMSETFRNLLAYLLSNQLLEKKDLVFFTDGANDIRKQIEAHFAFHPYTIILDWYHLKKRCQEYLSMSIRGGKEQRNTILQKLLRILWVGNVPEAIAVLEGLDNALLRPANRIADLCRYFEKHQEHIPCYALRRRLGLPNSSNRVEKANDLVVAQRQKHNGMSWSVSGSTSLAQIKALFINDDAHVWLHCHFLPHFSSLAA